MFAHHIWTDTVYFLSDAEGNSPMFSATLLTATNGTMTQPAWFVTNNGTTGQITVEFNAPPQPTNNISTTYYIQVTLWDQFNVATPNYYYIEITNNYNFAPVMNTPVLNMTIPTIRV